jgi:hypothetical protein
MVMTIPFQSHPFLFLFNQPFWQSSKTYLVFSGLQKLPSQSNMMADINRKKRKMEKE